MYVSKYMQILNIELILDISDDFKWIISTFSLSANEGSWHFLRFLQNRYLYMKLENIFERQAICNLDLKILQSFYRKAWEYTYCG